jgi:hypothetical protein
MLFVPFLALHTRCGKPAFCMIATGGKNPGALRPALDFSQDPPPQLAQSSSTTGTFPNCVLPSVGVQ